MAELDRAIIVGIRHYPGLGNLDGPENDAKKFHEWVISKAGGDVPETSTRLILSSDYPAKDNPIEAEPAVEAIQRTVEELLQRAERSSEEGNGLRVGRRLYLYFSGHGFEPKPEQVVLLTANATRMRGHHVAGRIYADYFRRAGIFDEVLLFMDCCRGPDAPVELSIPPYVLMQSADAPEKGKWLVAYATKWSRKSRERMIDGIPQGIFTSALLKGLGGEAHDASGAVTAESLANYLYEHMKDPLTQEEIDDPGIPKQPDINYDKDPNNRLVIVSAPAAAAPPPQFPVVFNTPQASTGKDLTVLNDRFATVFKATITGPSAETKLSRGFYLAQIMADGVSVPFQVPSNELKGTTHVGL